MLNQIYQLNSFDLNNIDSCHSESGPGKTSKNSLLFPGYTQEYRKYLIRQYHKVGQPLRKNKINSFFHKHRAQMIDC